MTFLPKRKELIDWSRANQALSLLLVPPKHGAKGADAKPEPAMGFFNQREIYPGSKIKHFKELHAKTGIPYNEMVFYDDEGRNREVESLGVTFVLVPDGVNSRIFEKGLEEWRRRHPAQVVEDTGGDVEHRNEL
ncbi:hypothetical protein PENSPDRAFT_695303 [Peniophora sp. CONT]|nr:hypothetical protein PENSPDRAFT_695303 [Peniophora sp. CONT]